MLTAKAALRARVWAAVGAPGVRRFPAPDGRIPHFVGAEAAARRLATTPEWAGAGTLKANPDAPQLPVRALALQQGRTVFMAVPRLAGPEPFFLLDPAALADVPHKAATIAGAARSARTVDLDEMTPVDLVVTGCVAVGRDGARLGKGGGFSDLEFAVAAAAGLVDHRTVVVTTVHPLQVLDACVVPTTAHDVHVDVVVTPHEVIRCPRPSHHDLPRLRWDELTQDKITAIPLLGRLRARSTAPEGG